MTPLQLIFLGLGLATIVSAVMVVTSPKLIHAALWLIITLACVASYFVLLEAESEIVAGYNIEYSSMAFGMFFVGEFLHGFTIAALTVTLFLGGWLGPGVDRFPMLGLVYFGLKSALVYFGVIWIRGTLPRLRIDQVNAVNWKFLVPLSLAVVAVTAIADKLAALQAWNRIATLGAANLGLALVTAILVQRYARALRRREAMGNPAVQPARA